MYSLNFTYLYPEDSFNFEEVEVGWWSKILLSSSGYWTVNSYNLAFFWVLATFTYKLESFDFEEEEKEVGWWPQFLLSSSPCQTVILYIFFWRLDQIKNTFWILPTFRNSSLLTLRKKKKLVDGPNFCCRRQRATSKSTCHCCTQFQWLREWKTRKFDPSI